MAAAANGHLEAAALLLEHGALTEGENIFGESVFSLAQRSGNRDLVRLLGSIPSQK